MSGIKNPIISSIAASAFPISGLSRTTFESLRLFVPSPTCCFSNTAGTVRSVQDGPVALWRDVNEVGSKNLIQNPMIGGAVAGTPGTVPTGWRDITPSNGISRQITAIGSDIVDGRLVNFIEYRFTGTVSGGTATCFMDPIMAPGLPTASLGQQYVGSVYLRLMAGSLPTGTNVFSYIETLQRVASGAPSSIRKPNTIFNSLTIPQGWVRFSNPNTIDDPLATQVSLDIRTDIPVIGTVVNFTIRIAAPQLERGRLTPTQFEYSSVAIQATAGFQPRLRRGAKNWLTNSTLQGAVSGSPGTLPNNSQVILRSGLTRTITTAQEVVNGVLMPVLHIRWQGTVTDSGDFGFDWNSIGANSIPAVSGQLYCYSLWSRLVSGTLPSGWNIQVTGRNSSGTIVENSTVTANLNTEWQRYSINRLFNNATTAFVTAQNRRAVSPGDIIDVTIGFAAPQLELGVSTPSAYAPTSGAFASNGIGPWWLDFDGVQNRMEMTSPIISGGSQGWTITGIEPNTSMTLNGVVFGNTLTTTTTTPSWGGLLFERTTGSISSLWRNDANSSSIITSNQNIRQVYSSVTTATNGLVRSSGIQRNSASLPSQPITINASTIGCFRRNNNIDSFYRGEIYGLALGSVPITTTEVLNIERYIGRLMGITI